MGSGTIYGYSNTGIILVGDSTHSCENTGCSVGVDLVAVSSVSTGEEKREPDISHQPEAWKKKHKMSLPRWQRK